jgi:hypothetical protein
MSWAKTPRDCGRGGPEMPQFQATPHSPGCWTDVNSLTLNGRPFVVKNRLKAGLRTAEPPEGGTTNDGDSAEISRADALLSRRGWVN